MLIKVNRKEKQRLTISPNNVSTAKFNHSGPIKYRGKSWIAAYRKSKKEVFRTCRYHLLKWLTEKNLPLFHYLNSFIGAR